MQVTIPWVSSASPARPDPPSFESIAATSVVATGAAPPFGGATVTSIQLVKVSSFAGESPVVQTTFTEPYTDLDFTLTGLTPDTVYFYLYRLNWAGGQLDSGVSTVTTAVS